MIGTVNKIAKNAGTADYRGSGKYRYNRACFITFEWELAEQEVRTLLMSRMVMFAKGNFYSSIYIYGWIKLCISSQFIISKKYPYKNHRFLKGIDHIFCVQNAIH